MLSTLQVSFYRLLTLVISFGLLLLSPGAQQFVIAQTESSEYEQALERLDLFMEKLEELRSHVDRTQFDVEELSFELAFEDPETIVDWVRNNIYFEQYPGLLRGAQGTLMSRAGNALDQAVLLQKILSNAGYETQIARGSLSVEQAQLLIQQMNTVRPPPQPFANLEGMEKTLNEMAAYGEEPTEVNLSEITDSLLDLSTTDFYLKAMVDAEWIIDKVVEADQTLGDDSFLDNLVVEASDYFWVEYRISESDPWTGAHPCFVDTSSFSEPTAAETYTDSLPKNLQHHFRFSAFVERSQGEKIEALPVMDSWEQPTASMAGTILNYTNIPDTVSAVTDLTNVENILDNSEAFVPILNGKMPSGVQAFDFEGFLLDPYVSNDATAGVFRSTAQQTEEAIGAIGSLGQETEVVADDIFTLTAHWFEYTLIAPDGKETKHKRYVFDRIGDVARAAGSTELQTMDRKDIVKALTASTTFMLSTGTYSKGYIFDRKIEQVLKMYPTLTAVLKEGLEGFSNVETYLPWLGHFDIYNIFDEGANTFGELAYRSEPSLMIYQQTLGEVDTKEITLDIVNNYRRTFAISGDEIVFNPTLAVRIGVWETQMEGKSFKGGEEVLSYVDTAEVFDRVKAEEIPTKLITTEQELDEISLDDSVKNTLRAEIQSGFAVLVPTHLPEESDLAAWWRVDLNTGQTLGIIEPGLGGTALEYIVIGIEIVLALVTAHSTYTACIKEGSQISELGCALCAAILAAISAIVGLGIAKIGKALSNMLAKSDKLAQLGRSFAEKARNFQTRPDVPAGKISEAAESAAEYAEEAWALAQQAINEKKLLGFFRNKGVLSKQIQEKIEKAEKAARLARDEARKLSTNPDNDFMNPYFGSARDLIDDAIDFDDAAQLAKKGAEEISEASKFDALSKGGGIMGSICNYFETLVGG